MYQIEPYVTYVLAYFQYHGLSHSNTTRVMPSVACRLMQLSQMANEESFHEKMPHRTLWKDIHDSVFNHAASSDIVDFEMAVMTKPLCLMSPIPDLSQTVSRKVSTR